MLIVNSLSGPLQEAVRIADTLARGELVASRHAAGNDEVGQLIASMNRMTDYLREMASTAKAFVNGVNEVYQEYEREKAKYPGKLPVIVLVSTTPVKSGNGSNTSTNYQPKFKIDGWAPRPEDLAHIPVTADAPATAPSTGSTAVAPPAAAAAVSADDDFG